MTYSTYHGRNHNHDWSTANPPAVNLGSRQAHITAVEQLADVVAEGIGGSAELMPQFRNAAGSTVIRHLEARFGLWCGGPASPAA